MRLAFVPLFQCTCRRCRTPRASFLAEIRVIFNIKGDNHRLVVKARYQYGIVSIEWIGVHAEYDKQDFQERRK